MDKNTKTNDQATVQAVDLDTQVIPKILEIIKNAGETEYKYYAIPYTWRNGKGRSRGYHSSPITGLEVYEVSKEEFDKNKTESVILKNKAFYGQWNRSYISYEKRISKPGWRELLIMWLKDDNNFSV